MTEQRLPKPQTYNGDLNRLPTALEHLRGEKVERRIDTGVVLVTPENMERPEIKELLYPPLDEYLK